MQSPLAQQAQFCLHQVHGFLLHWQSLSRQQTEHRSQFRHLPYLATATEHMPVGWCAAPPCACFTTSVQPKQTLHAMSGCPLLVHSVHFLLNTISQWNFSHSGPGVSLHLGQKVYFFPFFRSVKFGSEIPPLLMYSQSIGSNFSSLLMQFHMRPAF